jgi:hypothetical protein
MDNRKLMPYVVIVIAILFIGGLFFMVKGMNTGKTEDTEMGVLGVLPLTGSLRYVNFRGHEYLVNGSSTPLHLPDCRDRQHKLN